MEIELILDRYANGYRQYAGQVVEESEEYAAALIARGVARPATIFPPLPFEATDTPHGVETATPAGNVEIKTNEPPAVEFTNQQRRRKGR